MLSRDTIHTTVGIIGNVVSFGLFVSPVPTFIRICKNKSVEEFSPIPYLATILNCVLWVFYGIIHPNSILVSTINGIGLVIELAYIAIFFFFANAKKRKMVTLWLAGEAVFFGAVVAVTLLAFHQEKQRSLILGIVCDIFNILMYASPLIVMKDVIKTKSVEFMPFWLSFTNFFNALIWTAFALIVFDPYVLTSNGIGSISGLVQLILYGCYYKSTPKNVGEKVKQSELELSGANAV